MTNLGSQAAASQFFLFEISSHACLCLSPQRGATHPGARLPFTCMTCQKQCSHGEKYVCDLPKMVLTPKVTFEYP